MSLEAIEKVTEIESKTRERRAAAEAEARQIVADAESGGLALLRQVRADAAESGKKLMQQAEEKAAKRTAEVAKTAEADGAALRKTAGTHLEDAAEFIVGRVVKH
jgi:vacuolar-type H+-ATPase subunit H